MNLSSSGRLMAVQAVPTVRVVNPTENWKLMRMEEVVLVKY